jgi:TIR domain
MKVFVSYARRDRETVELLLQDMRRAQHTVWVDEQLTGGQAWWDTILATIRGADLFVIALSPDLLKSRACHAEYQYAVACRRTVLPVMVATVSPQMAPPAIANAQILNYVERTPNATIDLVTALATAQPSQELPDPPPPPPPVPMSYMNTYRERLDELSLNLQQQSLLLSELRIHLNDEDDRDTAIELIRRLRSRGDITESVGREIDSLLASLPKAIERQAWGAPPAQGADPTAGVQTAPPPETAGDPVPASTGAEWRRDPYGRFEQRFWSGTEWTDHVSTGGRQMKDLPGERPKDAVASVDPSEQPFTTGTFVVLIIATVIIPLIGIIVGAINMSKPGRKKQSKILVAIGIGVVALFILASA